MDATSAPPPVADPGSVDPTAPTREDATEEIQLPPVPPKHDEPATEPDADEQPPINATMTSTAAVLASMAAGWMLGGPFEGYFAEAVGGLTALLTGLLLIVSYRSTRPATIQFLALPAAVAGATALALPSGAELYELPSLVLESLRSGGLSAPPVAFDPGWRILLVLVTSWLTVTAATAAMALDKARMAVLIPGAVALAAILIQAPGEEFISVSVALVLVIGGLAVAFGAELARIGAATKGKFEIRRLSRAGVMAVLLVAAMFGLAQLGFLFPEVDTNQVIPPQRPEVPPPPRDRVLFTVEMPEQAPLRVGVLDVYRENAWMTPPFDPARLVDLVVADGVIANAVPRGLDAPGAVVAPKDTVEATFTLIDVEGRVVPLLAGATVIDGDFDRLDYDPRTQTLRVSGRQREGTTYAVEAAKAVDSARLAATPAVDPQKDLSLAEFLDAPKPGPIAERLLEEALAQDAPPYEQLQYVRTKFYDKVIAAGKGDPVDVPARRIDQMLQEAEANPYEIVAAEVLLARMVGVPARIGYGYYGGDVPKGGDGSMREVRPKHGAMWLEAYFQGEGWVPILGRPPRAKASLDQDDKITDPNVAATDQIAARVYVPVKSDTFAPIYVLLRYWLARILPIVIGLVVVIGGYPALFKLARRWRRRRWADRRGPRARIAVAYAEIRDRANDLNIGHPSLTPIEFLDAVEADVEHRELAWLVTRVMWGDLRRDVRPEDATAAEEVARSFDKRFVGGQPYAMRVLGAVARVSLKEPWDPMLPNLWWGWRRKLKKQIAVERGAVAPTRMKRKRRITLKRPAVIPALLKQKRRMASESSDAVAAIPAKQKRRITLRRGRADAPRPKQRRNKPLKPRSRARFRQRVRLPRLRVLVPAATVIAIAAAIATTGGVRDIDLTTPVSFEVPDVPSTVPGFGLERVKRAEKVFRKMNKDGQSLASGGEFYAIRQDLPAVVAGKDPARKGLVVGSLQATAFKPGVRSRTEELRQGMLDRLLIAQDDVVRLGGEQVYVKRIPEQTLYLWLAPDTSTFQLMVATRDFVDADAFMSALLAIQRGEDVDVLEPPSDRPPIDPRRGTP